jgi:diguanylate cyclase
VADGVPIAAYDRVVRIAGWAWILSTGILVAASGLWTDRQGAILAILGIAGLFVLVAHDLLPVGALGRAKYLVEGCVSIVFVTLIVLLTGGAPSPFFFAFVLIVVGAALVVPPAAAVALAVLAAASYVIAIAVDLAPGGLDVAAMAVVGVNLVSLILLAYVAMVVAREQRRTRQVAVRLSTTDALTGLANRAYIRAAVEREIERGTRYGRGFCLLMADLDDLKSVNDSYGHRAGDRVLAGVADVIRDGVRRIDTPARLGGDEYVVLLPETDPTGAFVVAEKIRQGVAAMRTLVRDGPLTVSVSIGLVAWPDDGATLDELMNAVDEAMYASKRRGKNRIVGPYSRAGEMAPVIRAASPVTDRRGPVSVHERVGRAV